MRCLACVLLVLACGAPGQSPPREPPVEVDLPADGRLPHAHRIDDEATWQSLCARPRNHVVARTEIVKFLIDLRGERRLWFVDTERWEIHYEFARDQLNLLPPGYTAEQNRVAHEEFNVREYRTPERRFAMGTISHYLDSDLWTLEMIAGDNLPGEGIVEMYEQIQRAVFFGEQLRYRPISALHEEMIAPVRDRIPTVSSDAAFAGVRYQPLTDGVAFGTLRFVRGELDPSSVRPDQILALEEIPDQIPVTSAVITQRLQAPLGHIAILCANRGTPNMGLRDALSDPRLAALENHLVRLEIGSQDFTIAEASVAEAEAAWATRRPAQALVPQLDATVSAIQDVCSLHIGDANRVGAKAAQLGEACSMGPPIVTPGGFAIPFAHYLAHLERAGMARGIPAMLADPTFRANAETRALRLAELRAAIQRATVDRALVRQVHQRIARFPNAPRVIMRSSTNAEDLSGFTGAGLYDSIVVPGGATEAQIADALRRVWASVWLQAAHEEREWYRVDHARVAMGVLVQPFVDGAAINGVAITANPFYAGRPAVFVNAQALGGSVTGAGGDEIPEQHLIYTYSGSPEPELLSRSSRNHGAPLLSGSEIVALTDVLEALHVHFTTMWSTPTLPICPSVRERCVAVDVEYLIAGADRHVVVLQARPFTVNYAEGQRWTD
jgi:hypothetical protein